MEAQTTIVSITIEMRKNRIRLHSSLYHALGEPQYIQLLVNPNEKKLCIKSVDSMSAFTQPIKVSTSKATENYELYSCTLITKLSKEMNVTNKEASYKLNGIASSANRIAIFSFNKLENITEQ